MHKYNGGDSLNLSKFYVSWRKERERENTIFIKILDKAENFISQKSRIFCEL